jgi:hypothetical protein
MGTAATTVINVDDDLDPAVVDANFSAILSELNGNLQAITNIQIASAVAITGNQNLAGTSASLAASDHQHIVRGVENLTTNPTSGNFAGRIWYDTTTKQWKGISDLSGPTIKVLGNESATDLVQHASQHVDGAADQLADTSIAERSMKARTIAAATLAANVGPFTPATWTTIVDLSVTTTGIQTLAVDVNVYIQNSEAQNRQVGLRVVDVTASNTTIWRSSGVQQMGATGSGSDQMALTAGFKYTVPATGARTLRVQAFGPSGTNLSAVKSANIGGDLLVPPTIMAVII